MTRRTTLLLLVVEETDDAADPPSVSEARLAKCEPSKVVETTAELPSNVVKMLRRTA